MIIARKIEPVLSRLSKEYPVVTVTGPRQSGKTTLCKKVFPEKPYVSLEALDIRQFAEEDPRSFLARYSEGAIIDEIQRVPGLVSYLQTFVDEKQRPGQFILTGSQQFEVLSNITQSLAGRTALLKLLPFSIEELKGHYAIPSVDYLLRKGFYPRIFDKKLNPTQALGDYFETYVERDLRLLVNVRDLSLFQKFVRLCAGRVGQLLNLQSLANDAGVSHTTARNWLTLLEASFIIFILQPYHRNISKRLIKSPKLYFYDVGLASYLLGLENELQVSRDPLRGNLFENMAVAELLKYRYHQGKKNNLSFYRDSSGNEVDVLLEFGSDLFPIEIKAGATITKDYFRGLKHFTNLHKSLPMGSGLIYGGNEIQQRSEIRICPILRTAELLSEVSFFSDQ